MLYKDSKMILLSILVMGLMLFLLVKPNAHRLQKSRNKKQKGHFVFSQADARVRWPKTENSKTIVWLNTCFAKQALAVLVSGNAVSRNTVFCFCPTHTDGRKHETCFLFRVSRFLSSVCVRLKGAQCYKMCR